MLTIRADVNGNWKPNDLPPLEVDSVRSLRFTMGAAIGAATISTFTITADNVTFGTPTVASPAVTVTMTAPWRGDHVISTSAVLSNGETIKGALRLMVVDTACTGHDYD